jgi:hypothetical protein
MRRIESDSDHCDVHDRNFLRGLAHAEWGRALSRPAKRSGLMKETLNKNLLDPGDGSLRDDASLLFGRINVHNSAF